MTNGVKQMKSVRRKVQKVIDGDSFKVHRRVQGSQYVRVSGLNTPERGQRGYMAAKIRLGRITGKTVTIRPVGKSYGRTVGRVTYRRKRLR